MRKICYLFLTLVTGVYSSVLNAQNIFSGFEHLFTPVRNYVVYRAPEEIVVDGKAVEKSWNLAEWSEEFMDIEGGNKPEPKHKNRM